MNAVWESVQTGPPAGVMPWGQEQWLGLVEFPGYEVSTLGRVGSHFRTTQGGNRLVVESDLKFLKPIMRFGYRCFGLRRRDGKIKIKRASILVLNAFRGSQPRGQVARHLDDVRDNDCLSNLAWGTQSENMADAVRNGFKYACGERHGQTSLRNNEVRYIRRMIEEGHTQRSLADDFNVCQSTISRIAGRKRWRHLQ